MRLLVLTTLVSRCAAAPPPATMAEFECAIAQFGAKLAASKIASSAAAAYDAFNVDFLCANVSLSSSAELPDVTRGLAREAARTSVARDAAIASARGSAFTTSFFVATTGDDAGAGTAAAPFATLPRAAAAARAVTPRAVGDVAVYVRAGTYYMGDAPLLLTELDSNVTWLGGWPQDPPGGAPVVLSGARQLSGLSWAPAQDGPAGAFEAHVDIHDARATSWRAAHPSHTGAGPPPLVLSLFVNDERYVRARYPNANPDDGSGPCFSATQRPGEGCAGWSNASIGSTGVQPAPSGVVITGIGPDRGDSPTCGCPQCGNCGSFKYTIYPFPADHPVYNEPLRGLGWQNLSLFSFWASPFARPAGVTVNTAVDKHWAAVNYTHSLEGATVHMFHSGLWGGWSYAVDSVSFPNVSSAVKPERAAEAAPPLPSGLHLWLRADDLAIASGADVTSWPDASGSGSDATAASASGIAPTFNASCFGDMPCVHFNGSSALANMTAAFSSDEMSVFAVMRDTGTLTDYGSGIFFVRGSEVGIGSKVTVAEPQNDDDPAPVGSNVRVMMLDWGGSPADPGHRTLSKPSLLSATFSQSAGISGFVDGCLELSAPPHVASGAGFEVGSRNLEMGRYLVGDVAELLVFERALNLTERNAVDAYLREKWSLPPPPKHCTAAPVGVLTIKFGYGGYQEARGSGINPGQHFYIEGVREELDVPGEWHYDPSAGVLTVFPNGTDLSSATLAVPLVDEIVVINGSQARVDAYATDITFSGFTFTQSRPSFLEMYEVPSGGDWAVHRGGALFVQDAERIQLVDNVFTHTGGNGIFFSNHVVRSTVSDSEFTHLGDSGIVLAGSTISIDGSAPTYPDKTMLARNHLHEWGIYGKQTSCVALQLSSNTTIVDNVCFNGPRAGFNYNDGFGGGNLFKGNMVWNAVRETGDHGPLNSWDRQPYWTFSHVDDGFNDPAGRSFIRAWDLNENNFMLNGYNGVWTFDHDDCSQFVQDSDNFMIWGGCKNYIGSTKNCSDNVILYPGTAGRSAGNRRCQTDDNGVFANQYHASNICATADGAFYSFSDCKTTNLNTTVYRTRNNTLFADAGANFAQTCGENLDFAAWQALGQDAESTTTTTPSVAELIALGAAKVLGPAEIVKKAAGL